MRNVEVVHRARSLVLKVLEDRGANQVSKSETRGGEDAQGQQDESAEKENLTIQEKANHVTKQMGTPQIRDSGESEH